MAAKVRLCAEGPKDSNACARMTQKVIQHASMIDSISHSCNMGITEGSQCRTHEAAT